MICKECHRSEKSVRQGHVELEIEGVMINVVSGNAPAVGCEMEAKEIMEQVRLSGRIYSQGGESGD